MGTASLRIKFTPLFQNCNKYDSKCCLEIVPEVTCIQNLDQIQWKENSEIIEYTIPMTYKVILRKQRSERENEHFLDKIYHSCVDLLPPSSLTCVNLGSGDMTTMVSDTLLHRNFADSQEIENAKLKPITSSSKSLQNDLADVSNNDMPEQLVNDVASTPTSNDMKLSNTTKITVNASTSWLEFDNVENAVRKNSILNIVNSICELLASKENKTESLTLLPESVTEICTINNTVKEDYSRKLSLTPICSIDTNENSIHLMSCHAAYHLFETHKMTNNNETLKSSWLENDIESITNRSILCFDNSAIESLLRKECEFKRERPEVKVANFMKNMEIEIRPLKIMLHEILEKCSSLGLTNNEEYSFDSVLLKKVPSNNREVIKCCIAEKQARCNRVVYSVVFDG